MRAQLGARMKPSAPARVAALGRERGERGLVFGEVRHGLATCGSSVIAERWRGAHAERPPTREHGPPTRAVDARPVGDWHQRYAPSSAPRSSGSAGVLPHALAAPGVGVQPLPARVERAGVRD